MSGIEAKLTEAFPHKIAVMDDVLDPLGFFPHNLQGSQDGGGVRRWNAGAKNETARVVFDVIHHRELTRNKSTDRSH